MGHDTILLALIALAACSSGEITQPDASSLADVGARPDAGPSADAAAAPDLDWQTSYCATRECWFVMQRVNGSSDTACNGRHPADLGTMDTTGKRNCPFATLTGPIRDVLNPPTGRSSKKTIFVGGGSYPVAPFALSVRGDGADASEAVIFTTWRAEDVTIDGSCPASCTIQGPTGPVTLTPCCARECRTCDASPLCVPTRSCRPDARCPHRTSISS